MSPPPPVEAIAVAAALLVLALAVMFARAVRFTGPSRARRILVPAATVLIGAMLVMGMPSLFASPPLFHLDEFGWAALCVGLVALVSAAALDGVATLLGAERTPRWLGAGIIASVLLTYLGLALLTAGLFFALGVFAVTPGLVVAAGVITWWPYLPRPEGEGPDDEETADVFE